jgi:chemotaxis protein methyltransferase CheR
MPADALPDTLWSRLSTFIAEKTGLHFPADRRPDLQRGLMEAAAEFGFAEASTCADWLLSAHLTAPQLHTLASHLTIGETYFFRERQAFDALAKRILPELIRRRRGHEQRLRLWSAACSTGEEPYSLAILLHELLPDWRDWQVTILATDINPRFLQKAVAGVYGEWSFRGSPPPFKERYFTRTADRRFTVVPEIRKSVSFAQLNLAADGFPSVATDTQAMDVILCRNLLIYFTPPQARKLVENLRHALLDNGWLVVSPSECSQILFSQFVAMNFPGAILYRKSDPDNRTSAAWTAAAWTVPPAQPLEARIEEHPTPTATLADPCAAPDTPGPSADAPAPSAFSLRARALADQGKLTEALAWSERWVAADKLDAAAHYLHAMILQELGEPVAARRSLQRAVYLQPDFVLAHFALGNGARGGAQSPEAHKHFENALRLLRGRPVDEVVPESDGLTAGGLMEMIAALSSRGPSRG